MKLMWAGNVAHVTYGGKPNGKMPLVRSRRILVENSTLDVIELG